MLYSVIMAGGSGKRFWPVSTIERPKQLLSIAGDKSLIVETKERVKDITPEDRIKVITTKSLEEQIRDAGFKEDNIIIEPKGMNTLYAITLAAALLLHEDSDAKMLTLPSDHWIEDNKEFVSIISKGIDWAEKGYLITYGIVPGRPETGYGYIEKGDNLEEKTFRVRRFTEKPNIKKATNYIKSDRFLWNSGIFMWKAETILNQVKNHQPHLAEKIDDLIDNPSDNNIKDFYNSGNPISIDYGVLERSNKVLVIVSNFRWDDVGTWTSLERIYTQTENGNLKKGDVISLNNTNNIFYSDGGIIVAKGLSNMIVVHTERATLIIPKTDAQEVKELVKKIPPEYR